MTSSGPSKITRGIYVALWLITLFVISLPNLTRFYYTAVDYYAFAELLYHQTTLQRHWSNDRRDGVEVVTNWTPPFLSTFTFEPGNSQIETTLLTVNSKTIWVKAAWRDEDHVDVSLFLDRGAKIDQRVDEVGPVKITFSFIYKNGPATPPRPEWTRMERPPLF